MKLYLKKQLHLLGGIFIGFSLPIGVQILPGNYDLLFFPLGVLLTIISYYYTFLYKNL